MQNGLQCHKYVPRSDFAAKFQLRSNPDGIRTNNLGLDKAALANINYQWKPNLQRHMRSHPPPSPLLDNILNPRDFVKECALFAERAHFRN